jgi:hypothetical protein
MNDAEVGWLGTLAVALVAGVARLAVSPSVWGVGMVVVVDGLFFATVVGFLAFSLLLAPRLSPRGAG